MINEPPSVRPEERTVVQEPEPSECPEGVFLVVGVFSAPGNSLARRTIRRQRVQRSNGKSWPRELRTSPKAWHNTWMMITRRARNHHQW